MKSKVIIAMWGSAAQGKSDTVRRVAQLIGRKPGAQVNPIIVQGDIKEIITLGKVVIGIESQGDPNSRMAASLDEFAAYPCDIIICTCRSGGATVWKIEEVAVNFGYEIIWVTNHRSPTKSQPILNQMSAEEIERLVDAVITGNL